MGYLYYGYENIITILLLIAGSVITIWAQVNINSKYKKYKKIENSNKLCGSEVARKILDSNGLSNIYVVETTGELSDHYDPSRKVIKLSHDIFHGESIASISVAAHECGHAIQDKEGYKPMRLRSSLVPIVNFVSYAGYFVLIISAIFGATGYFGVGIIILMATLLFQLVTLPVEFDASKRAKEQLLKLNLITEKEGENVKSMLGAAALTYVASLISTLLNVLRLVLKLLSSRRRD